MCGMNFINLIRIQFIFGIEDQLILSYNPRLFFIFMSVIYNWSDMEMRNSRTLDKNRKERNDFSEMASPPAG